MSQNLKQKAVKGVMWSAIERFSAQGVQFILGLILARLLTPEDYGLIGMLAIFLAISQTFIDSGFSSALIQKKGRDELDYSTSFYFNIVVGFFCYLILFFAAPLIAWFYDQPQLIELTRVVGLTLVINSLGVVQRAQLSIKVDFKTQTKASLTAITISGLLGIYLAYHGYGVWSLVAQTLVRRFLDVMILWFLSKWKPRDGFSMARFKSLFSFGSKLLLSGLLNTVYQNIYTIVIGKVFSAGALGFYTRARQFAAFPSSNLTGILNRVTFPVLSEVQDDDLRLKTAYKKMIMLSALIVFPLMVGLAALAKPLIIQVLTEKWAESVWMLQILCFAMMWYPIHAINLNVINVKGRSDLFLRLEIIKKIVITIVLVISIPIGIKVMLMGSVFTSIFALVINTYYTKRIIDYGFWQQMRDLLPVLGLSLLMGGVIFVLIQLITPLWLQLLVGFIVGVSLYVGIAWSFNVGGIREAKVFLKRK